MAFFYLIYFKLIGADGYTEIGAIYKKYRGFLNESTTSADAFLLQGKLIVNNKQPVSF